MSEIIIGKSENRNVKLDVDILLRTRLLVQANSGGGKSFLLRRLAEQFFGKVQVIIIDPEGEFSTLREKFGYVLVGKGGETPADPRSAGLVAEKLLELHASAVCDLYEMKPLDRHHWVRLFLEALVDAPKKLWHPVAVIVDEAHVFSPEKSAGESEASDAMIALATRGRKRGFAAVFATQRLGKLRKDAAAELQNVLVGLTTIDIDRKRAADQLGIYGADQREFFDNVKMLKPGQFYALGRAISIDRILLQVGGIETTHPEAGSTKHNLEPPPTPDRVKAMLPKLADLPQAAEEKARTEKELRTEIQALKRALKTVPVTAPVTQQDPRLAKANSSLRELVEDMYKVIIEHKLWLEKHGAGISEQMIRVKGEAEDAAAMHRLLAKIERQVQTRIKGLPDPPKEGKIVERADVTMNAWQSAPTLNFSQEARPRSKKVERLEGETIPVTGPMKKILVTLAELAAIGQDNPRKAMVAGWAAYSPTSGGYANTLGSLRTAGLIRYPSPGLVGLTSAGHQHVDPMPPPSQEEVRRRILSVCSGPEQKILQVLMDHGTEAMSKVEIAQAAGYSETSGGYANTLGMLRTKGFIDYPDKGMVQPAEWLFME